MSDCISCDMYRKAQREQKMCEVLDDSDECRIVMEYDEDDYEEDV